MSPPHLLRDRKFWPLFWTQFCGAFNDNVFKFALIGLIITHARDIKVLGLDSTGLQALASGLFILPFFLFSATAGQFADKYDKATLIRLIKIFEIGVMSLAVVGFLGKSIVFLMLVLFLMGLQSTLFGPIKYSILPQHVDESRLTEANGYVEMGTFIAILVGTIIGTSFIEIDGYGPYVICSAIIAIAILGYGFSRAIPDAPASDPHFKISFNILMRTVEQVKHAFEQRTVFYAILGISWFWFVGAVLLTVIQPLATETLHGQLGLRLVLLTCTTVGIGVGSVVCGRLAHGKLSNHLVPIGAIGISLFGADLYFSSNALVNQLHIHGLAPHTLVTMSTLFESFQTYRLLADLFLFGIFGGFYIVPLYVILQLESPAASRSRNIAVNNIMNALFMVISAMMIIGLELGGYSIGEILLITAGLNALLCSLFFIVQPMYVRAFADFVRAKLKRDQMDG